jgi:hypothetical protein
VIAAEREQFVKVIAGLEQQIKQMSGAVTTTVEDRFYDALERAVPDWETVNTSAEFLRWLDETDPVYGVTRQAALDNASRSFDTPRVVAIFSAFKRLTGGGTTPTPAPAVPTTKSDDALRRQVSPSTAPSGAAPSGGAADKREWRLSEYVDAINPRNRARLGDAQAAALAAQADKALQEGRVRT